MRTPMPAGRSGGIALVNDYYGYYQSWSQLSADLSGSYNSYAEPVHGHGVGAAGRTGSGSAVTTAIPQGKLERIILNGTVSHIRRPGLVYLPPQYFQKRYADTRFPVLELIHGSPGGPYNWVVQLQLVRVVDTLLAEHLMGPTVLVIPSMNQGDRFEECVNAPRAADDTYISQDVRSDITSRFRVSADPAEWGITGYSSGGYCAANLALRHPALFGAAAVMDGYFRPQDGPAAAALHDKPAAELANDPLWAAGGLSATSSPLPAFWLSAGTGDAGDFAAAQHFAAALHGVEQVSLYREPGAGHNFYAWAAALPHALTWLWTQLAPPDLRTDFPVAGGVQNSDIIAPPPPHTSAPPASNPAPMPTTTTT